MFRLRITRLLKHYNNNNALHHISCRSLSNSRESLVDHYNLLLHSKGQGMELSTLLQDIRKMRESKLTLPLVKKYFLFETATSKQLSLALRCFQDIRNPKAAWEFYNEAVAANPALNNEAVLVTLLNAIKYSKSYLVKGLDLYLAFYEDCATGNGTLYSHVDVAMTALKLVSNLCEHSKQTALQYMMKIKNQLQHKEIPLNNQFYSQIIIIAGNCGDRVIAESFYREAYSHEVNNCKEFQNNEYYNDVLEESMLIAAAAYGDYVNAVKCYHTIHNLKPFASVAAIVSVVKLCMYERADMAEVIAVEALEKWLKHNRYFVISWDIGRAILQVANKPNVYEMLVKKTLQQNANRNILLHKEDSNTQCLIERKTELLLRLYKDVSQTIDEQQHLSIIFHEESIPPAVLKGIAPVFSIHGQIQKLLDYIELVERSKRNEHRKGYLLGLVAVSAAHNLMTQGMWRELISLSSCIRKHRPGPTFKPIHDLENSVAKYDASINEVTAAVKVHSMCMLSLLQQQHISWAVHVWRSCILPIYSHCCIQDFQNIKNSNLKGKSLVSAAVIHSLSEIFRNNCTNVEASKLLLLLEVSLLEPQITGEEEIADSAYQRQKEILLKLRERLQNSFL